MIGKSTGIALLMAAALLAALFAMGVFSATGVGAHGGHAADDDDHLAQLSTMRIDVGPAPDSAPTGATILDPKSIQLLMRLMTDTP